MLLNDRQIRTAITDGSIVLTPRENLDLRIQPASLDVRLGANFGWYNHHTINVIDPKVDQSEHFITFEANERDGFILQPGDFVLGHTQEELGLPSKKLVARVEGRSSLGRIGLMVHCTAGFVDPGWEHASITLELKNIVNVGIRLYPGMPIGQLAFERIEEANQGYNGKYRQQRAPEASRFHRNWTGTQWT